MLEGQCPSNLPSCARRFPWRVCRGVGSLLFVVVGPWTLRGVSTKNVHNTMVKRVYQRDREAMAPELVVIIVRRRCRCHRCCRCRRCDVIRVVPGGLFGHASKINQVCQHFGFGCAVSSALFARISVTKLSIQYYPNLTSITHSQTPTIFTSPQRFKRCCKYNYLLCYR